MSVLSKKGGQYTLRVVYASPLNTRAAMLTVRDMERKGYDGSVDTLRVSGDDFLDMLPDARTIDDGDKRRRVVSFSRNWPVTFVDRPPRYLEDNGTVVTRLADAVAERQLPLWAEHRERTSPEVAATLNAGDWLSQMDGPIPADKWAALCTAIKDTAQSEGRGNRYQAGDALRWAVCVAGGRCEGVARAGRVPGVLRRGVWGGGLCLG